MSDLTLAYRPHPNWNISSVDEKQQRRFIIWGMPRTGTTFLYHTLPRHPEVFVPYRKESMFFTVNHVNGIDWYNSLYEGQSETETGADINPLYYLDAEASKRAKSFNPDVKVVLGIREPVDFAKSLYSNLVAHSFDVGSVVDMVKGYQWHVDKEKVLEFSLLDGFMGHRVNELRETFGKNLLIYDYRDFKQSPLFLLQTLERFLGLAPFFTESNFENIRINASSRRDYRIINSLIKNQRFLEFAYKVLPNPAIRTARRVYETLSARNEGKASSVADRSKTDSTEHDSVLQTMLSDDQAYYQSLFEDASILDGDGNLLGEP